MEVQIIQILGIIGDRLRKGLSTLPGKMMYFLMLTPGSNFGLTQLDITIQCEKDVPSLQVSVDDFVVVEVDEGLQSLLTHHPDLRLCQRSLQFCREGMTVMWNMEYTIAI